MTLPNFTQVSNEFIALLPQLTGEEVKIFLAISRKTIGWHKESDRIPYSQLKAMTGIKSHETLKKAAAQLQKLGLIDITGGAKSGYTYDLAMRSGRTQEAGECDGVAQGECDGVAPHKETLQKKPKTLPTEAAAPAANEPIPFDLATIREDVAKAERGMAECAPMPIGGAEAAPLDIGMEAAPPGKALEDRLWHKFLAIQPDQRFPSGTYAKERKGLHRLVKEAFIRQPDDPEAWVSAYLAAWGRLKRDRKSLINGQPNTPACMSSGAFMVRVIDEMSQAYLFQDAGPVEEIPWGRV